MSLDKPYGGFKNWATWDAKLMFSDLYENDKEVKEEIVDNIINNMSININENTKLKDFKNILSQCMTNEILRFQDELEYKYEEILENQFDIMTPKEIFNYGKKIGDQEVDFKAIAETIIKNFPIYLATYIDNKNTQRIEFGNSENSLINKIKNNTSDYIFITQGTFNSFLSEEVFNNIINKLEERHKDYLQNNDERKTRNTHPVSKKQKNVNIYPS